MGLCGRPSGRPALAGFHKVVPIGKAAVDVLADIPRIEGNPYVITGKVEGQYLTDIQKPWRRLRASRAGHAAHSRSAPFLRIGRAPAWRGPDHDREAIGAYAGADNRTVCSPQDKLCSKNSG